MTADNGLNRRVETLEIRLMHQERTIEDLNAAITAQWRQIDGLVRQVTQLTDRLRDLGAGPSLGQEPPPPHY